ncbi:hypothetical protein SE18_26050 [Herpetosiphon geysericola]|uniref:Uncharacterized protein n=2 Tax=Herpetosiphon geysericola TaxID=70996 RepID=A0A0P6YCE5_9CHLR|nr:hypothetical protein SE18_26050 [Herpetosiphon geysericola]
MTPCRMPHDPVLVASLHAGLSALGPLDRTAIGRIWFPTKGDQAIRRILRPLVQQHLLHATVISNGRQRIAMRYHATAVGATTDPILPPIRMAAALLETAQRLSDLVSVQTTVLDTYRGGGRIVGLRTRSASRRRPSAPVPILRWNTAAPREREQDTWYLLVPDHEQVSRDQHAMRARWYRELATTRGFPVPIPLILTTPQRMALVEYAWTPHWPQIVLGDATPDGPWTDVAWQPIIDGKAIPPPVPITQLAR